MVRPHVVARGDWDHAPQRVFRRSTPNQIVVHHEAAPAPSAALTEKRLRGISAFHRRKWADIAYGFLIAPDGVIYEGRWGSLAAGESGQCVPGAHVRGANSRSLGVCLLGNFEIEAPTAEQWHATTLLLGWLAFVCKIQTAAIKGHGQALREAVGASTACPGRLLLARFGELVAETRAIKLAWMDDTRGDT